jgi:hypothetical protein
VHALTGEHKQQLCARVLHAHQHEQGRHQAEYAYYPHEFVEPYLGRRRKSGLDLAGACGRRPPKSLPGSQES